jgi:alkylation response protein AidB-like acyl-CoA dehydrogenase
VIDEAIGGAPGTTLTERDRIDDFQSQVRQWFADHRPRDWRREQLNFSSSDYVAFQRSWFQELRRGGFAAPHWPQEWGGGGFSLPEQLVIHREFVRVDAPRTDLFVVSLNHVAATLMEDGSDEQRETHLPAILDGAVWCQGFSEPQAGSDLASLRTRAIRDGDHYVVNGQKIWSSMAHYADWCVLLARTDAAAPKHKGLSLFLLDMRSEGVDVRPIRDCAGEFKFCEIFLTDVAIPVANLVGAENDGWRVAQNTLGTERGTIMLEFAERLGHELNLLVDVCARRDLESGVRAIDDPAVRESLATLHGDSEVLRLLSERMVDNLVRGSGVGPEASVIKIFYSELLRRVVDLGVEIDGLDSHLAVRRPPGSLCESGVWMLDFVSSWMWTIAAGTNEILRTVIAERILGLPRESRGKTA